MRSFERFCGLRPGFDFGKSYSRLCGCHRLDGYWISEWIRKMVYFDRAADLTESKINSDFEVEAYLMIHHFDDILSMFIGMLMTTHIAAKQSNCIHP